MEAVKALGLSRTFRVRAGGSGARGAVRALFRPERRVVEAVRGVSFTAAEGEAMALIGPNGAGKSTTIKMLSGILHPSAGSARVLGRVPWQERERLAFDIGTVFGQKSQLWFHLAPLDSFNLLARIYELDPATYRRRRGELVERFGIGDYLRTPVRKLSLGQRIRCELAAALLHRPRVIFLDEPTIGLDISGKQAVRDLVSALNREEGVTLVLTSHDVGDVATLCRRAVVINHGRVVFDGAVNGLRRAYLGTKVVDLKLGARVSGFVCPGARVLKVGEYGVKLEVATGQNQVAEVLSYLLARYPVVDINIQDPPLEEVIAAIYRRGEEVAPVEGP